MALTPGDISQCVSQLNCNLASFDKTVADKLFSDAAHWPKIVLFGDSLIEKSTNFDDFTNGFSVSLSSQLSRRADLVLRAFSGYNTRWLLPALHYILQDSIFSALAEKSQVAGFFILLGANDSVIPMEPHEEDQHVPLDEYTQNLHAMIRLIAKHVPRERIVLITPPPCGIYKWMDHCDMLHRDLTKFNRIADGIVPYVNAVRNVAREEKLDCIDLHAEMLHHDDWQKFFVDGLHFGREGNELVANLLKNKIDSLLKNMPEGSKGKTIFPDWKTTSLEFYKKR